MGRVVLTGCGTALHAAMIGEYLIEALAQIPTKWNTPASFATATPR
jgi:glucosamine--fructose-6-phosphate aminotransferase (isomerizing)